MRIEIQSADPINQIFNAPGCREEHFLPGHLENNPNARHELSHVLRQGGFSVLGDKMGWIFNRVSVGVYEGHSAILPEKRGPATLAYFWDCVNTVFTQTDAMEIMTRCPVDSAATNRIAEALGMKLLYKADGAWGGVDMNCYSLSVSNWASACRAYRGLGVWIHDQFEANGGLHEGHEDSDTHLCHAGIAVEMARRGHAPKGAHVYNCWAAMNNYDPVEVLCLDPVILRTRWRDDKAELGYTNIDYLVKPDGLERV